MIAAPRPNLVGAAESNPKPHADDITCPIDVWDTDSRTVLVGKISESECAKFGLRDGLRLGVRGERDTSLVQGNSTASRLAETEHVLDRDLK